MMSVYWNTRIRGLSPYVPGEQPQDGKIVKLNTNENPYPPSPKVIEAIKKAADEKLRLYPDPACTEFREAAAARYGVKPEQVFAGNGSDEVLAFAFAAFFEPGRDAPPVLFPDITYSFYPVYAELWGTPFRTVPLAEDFSIVVEDYLVPSGGAVIANPNAPTGLFLSLDGIFALAAYLEQQGRVLVVDEAYIAFAGGGRRCPADSAVSFIGKYRNILTVHTLSKSASLAGLRAGFALGDQALIEGLCRVRDSFNSYTLDRIALAGAAAALSDAAYYDGITEKIIKTRGRVSAELEGMGFTVPPSSANFIFVRHPRLGGREFFAALRERGILVRHFDRPRIADYLRVSMGSDGDMDRFLDACRGI
ncbi:MAG: aminotransferase class I/II-fold pyridoxal phosphate-dependent enzyme [Treponema sp.]|jgi:histidinol-phosphate aminotransferase|nr:aminotransferase class I/II-fold pyridoxal phosphate-dependent enzyme [Treponema sp.]